MDEELSGELLERAGRDQAARMSLRPGRQMAEWDTAVAPVDRDNTARLREIIGQHGWPGHRLVGAAAAHAAWLLAQHAPPDVQEECLPLLRDAVARGDASPADLAAGLSFRQLCRGAAGQPGQGVCSWPAPPPASRPPTRAGPVPARCRDANRATTSPTAGSLVPGSGTGR